MEFLCMTQAPKCYHKFAVDIVRYAKTQHLINEAVKSGVLAPLLLQFTNYSRQQQQNESGLR